MRSAAVCALIVVPLSALTLTMQARRTAPSGSLRRKKRVYFTNLRNDIDWYLNGALLGAALAAVPVRRPAVIGWKRYLGAARIGAPGGRDVYVLKHRIMESMAGPCSCSRNMKSSSQATEVHVILLIFPENRANS